MATEAKRGIPDDSPENTVRAIVAICQEIADDIDATLVTNSETKRTSITTTIDFRLDDPVRSLRLCFDYIESWNLSGVSGSIGGGYVFPSATEFGDVGETWKLELLSGSTNDSPPFRWGLYPRDTSYPLDSEPSMLLDGPRLRSLVLERMRPKTPDWIQTNS